MPWWRASRGAHPLDRARARFAGARVPLWYSVDYRVPLSGLAGTTGLEPRRADLAIWFLVGNRLCRRDEVHQPVPIPYRDVARVHTPELLASLQDRSVLADIFACTPEEIVVDEILRMARLACGGTLAAARAARRRRGPALNLLGGFHHAGPARGGGLCPINDVAIAVAVLRAEGARGQIVILDLDAHPPDGTADCLAGDERVWIGSLSGADWGPLQGVDETVLTGADDARYLGALRGLLARMPRAELAFVLAGGDVLDCDRMGGLGLTLDGARRRDLMVAHKLGRTPAVWLPAGGYSKSAWRVLAGTVMALEIRSARPIPADYDPLRARFSSTSHSLSAGELGGGADDDPFGMSDLDLAELFGAVRPDRVRFLSYYTAEGMELALERYGILAYLRRLGYGPFRVELAGEALGDAVRLFGRADGAEHLLVECVVEPQPIGERRALFIHWLSLTHPRARFDAERPRLPGQEQPGLGMAREATEMLGRVARRLNLDGVAFRPAWYHIAYVARHDMAFVDPARQGRFEALVAALSELPLVEATRAVADGRVRLNGQPYTWEAEIMAYWLTPPDADADLHTDRAAIDEARADAHFTLHRGHDGAQ